MIKNSVHPSLCAYYTVYIYLSNSFSSNDYNISCSRIHGALLLLNINFDSNIAYHQLCWKQITLSVVATLELRPIKYILFFLAL